MPDTVSNLKKKEEQEKELIILLNSTTTKINNSAAQTAINKEIHEIINEIITLVNSHKNIFQAIKNNKMMLLNEKLDFFLLYTAHNRIRFESDCDITMDFDEYPNSFTQKLTIENNTIKLIFIKNKEQKAEINIVLNTPWNGQKHTITQKLFYPCYKRDFEIWKHFIRNWNNNWDKFIERFKAELTQISNKI